MKKIMQWLIAATLVCGTSVITSCTSGNDDNPAQEQAKKNRKEFVEHTRQTMKDLAENLNFSSWNAANNLNLYFNQYVLNNPEFEKTVLATFMQKMQQSVKPVEEGSELAEMGYKTYGVIDFTDFNYRFTENADNTGFNVEEADNFEVILNGWNPTTKKIENGIYKLTLKAGSTPGTKFEHANSKQPELATVVLLPIDFQFAISDKSNGTWTERFTGTFKNQVSVASGHEYAQLERDNWTCSGTISTNFPSMGSQAADKTTLNFSVFSDKVNNKGDVTLSWVQNDRKMIDLTLKETGDGSGGIYRLDLSKFTSSASIFDVIAALLTSRSLDEAKLTLLDDLATTLSISDMEKVVKLSQGYVSARRNYADQKTIDQYTQQFNELVKAEMTCKGVNQTIPMRLVTQKFGVDWWAMPAFNFADENGYVSLTELLDAESVTYGINIIDHAAEPMQQSIIVVRQLLQYLQTIMGTMQQQKGNE